MEDILASIRRILSDDEVKTGETPAAEAAPAAQPVDEPEDDDALVLDPSMMVQEAPPPPEIAVSPAPPPDAEQPPPPPPSLPLPPPSLPPAPSLATLVAPEAEAAAVSSVDNLVRTLYTERSMMVTSQGPTIEDIVRQEVRPLLKAWLDENLPPMVERLVRTEIERVVGRART